MLYLCILYVLYRMFLWIIFPTYWKIWWADTTVQLEHRRCVRFSNGCAYTHMIRLRHICIWYMSSAYIHMLHVYSIYTYATCLQLYTHLHVYSIYTHMIHVYTHDACLPHTRTWYVVYGLYTYDTCLRHIHTWYMSTLYTHMIHVYIIYTHDHVYGIYTHDTCLRHIYIWYMSTVLSINTL